MKTVKNLALVLSLSTLAVSTPSGIAGQSGEQTQLLVSAEWLATHLSDDALIVVHVGSDQSSYLAGHIPGARFLALSSILTQALGVPNELPPLNQLIEVFEAIGATNGSHFILYGDGGLAAARAFFTLDYLGFGDQTALLDGGAEAWTARGGQLSTDRVEFARGSIQPNVQAQIVVDAEWIRPRLGSETLRLIDARPPAQYSGAEAGRDVTRPGHLPGAVNFYWQDALVGGLLDDRAALERRYRQLGIGPGSEIVTYCRTGMQASHSYFVARYLGYQPRMYDASYLDWSARSELPVER